MDTDKQFGEGWSGEGVSYPLYHSATSSGRSDWQFAVNPSPCSGEQLPQRLLYHHPQNNWFPKNFTLLKHISSLILVCSS